MNVVNICSLYLWGKISGLFNPYPANVENMVSS